MIIILLSYLITKTKDKFIRRFLLCISILLPSILGGLRDISIGTDTSGYTDFIWNYMNHLNITSDVIFNQLMTEPGFAFFSYILYEISDNFQFYLFGITLLITSLFFITGYLLRDKLNYVLFITVYCFAFYNMSYNMMRQLCTLGFEALMIAMIIKGKYKSAIIPLVLSCLFHSSGIISIAIYVVMYLYDKKNLSTKMTLLIIFVAFLLSFSYNSIVMSLISLGILDAKFMIYTSASEMFEAKLPLSEYVLKLYFLFIAISLYRPTNTILAKESLLMGSLTVIISLVSLVVTYAGRLAYPFFIASIILSLIQIKGKAKYYTTLLVLLCIAYWSYTIMKSNNNDTYPYKFYFER